MELYKNFQVKSRYELMQLWLQDAPEYG